MEKVIDLHQDLMLHIKQPERYPMGSEQTSFALIEKSIAKIVFVTNFVVPKGANYFATESPALMEDYIEEYLQYIDGNNAWRIIKTQRDIIEVLTLPNQRGLVLSVEGMNVFSDTEDSWALLERWYEKGLRSFGIVWNLTNQLGGGTRESGGLTSLGKKAISWCQERGVIIDFAHANKETFWDMTKVVDGPIMVSHGNVSALCPEDRNYNDNQLKRIAESGGLIGITFVTQFLTNVPNEIVIEDVFKHIDYVVQNFGIDYVAIGSDLGGLTDPPLIPNLNTVTHLTALVKYLYDQDYSANDVDKILYKNAERVINSILYDV